MARAQRRNADTVVPGNRDHRSSDSRTALQADLARCYGVSQATISRLAAFSPFGASAVSA